MKNPDITTIRTNATTSGGRRADSNGLELLPIQRLPDGRLTAKEAARYLGISEKTLANHRWRGTGPEFIRLCGRIFYMIDALEAFVRQAPRATSTAQARLAALEQRVGISAFASASERATATRQGHGDPHEDQAGGG